MSPYSQQLRDLGNEQTKNNDPTLLREHIDEAIDRNPTVQESVLRALLARGPEANFISCLTEVSRSFDNLLVGESDEKKVQEYENQRNRIESAVNGIVRKSIVHSKRNLESAALTFLIPAERLNVADKMDMMLAQSRLSELSEDQFYGVNKQPRLQLIAKQLEQIYTELGSDFNRLVSALRITPPATPPAQPLDFERIIRDNRWAYDLDSLRKKSFLINTATSADLARNRLLRSDFDGFFSNKHLAGVSPDIVIDLLVGNKAAIAASALEASVKATLEQLYDRVLGASAEDRTRNLAKMLYLKVEQSTAGTNINLKNWTEYQMFETPRKEHIKNSIDETMRSNSGLKEADWKAISENLVDSLLASGVTMTAGGVLLPEPIERDKMSHLAKLLGLPKEASKDDIVNSIKSKMESSAKSIESVDKYIDEFNTDIVAMLDKFPFANENDPARKHGEYDKIFDANFSEFVKKFGSKVNYDSMTRTLIKIGESEKITPAVLAGTPGPYNKSHTEIAFKDVLNHKINKKRDDVLKYLLKAVGAEVEKIQSSSELDYRLRKFIERLGDDVSFGPLENNLNLDNVIYLLTQPPYNYAVNNTIYKEDLNKKKDFIFNFLKTHLNRTGGEMEVKNVLLAKVDTVRSSLYADISASAASLLTTAPINASDINLKAEDLLNQYLGNGNSLDEIAMALFMTKGSSHEQVANDIRNKFEALVSSERFDRNPNKLLSVPERRDVVDDLDACDSIAEELMRVLPNSAYPNKRAYMDYLYKVIATPSIDNVLFLKFKEIAAKHKNTGEIKMLYYIDFLSQLDKQGYTFNLQDISNKGFTPNELLKQYVNPSGPDQLNDFDMHMNAYRRFSERLEEYGEFLASATKRSKEQDEELNLIKALSGSKSKLNDLVKNIAENYKSEISGDSIILKRIIEKFYNPVKGSAKNHLMNAKGASAIEEFLAQAYKCIIAYNTVDVRRIETKTDFNQERAALNHSREHYANNRRQLTRFGWWRRSTEEDLEDSRHEYIKDSRAYITETIRHQYGDLNQGTDAEKKERATDMKNRILELLNKERRALICQETQIHGNSLWERFRTGFRRHKLLRWGVSRGLLIGAAALSFTAPPLSLGLLGLGSGLAALGTEVEIESVWEGVRDRFGKTKRIDRKAIKNMDVSTVQGLLAAHTTLAVSEKSGGIGYPDVDVRSRLPVTDESFNEREEPAVNTAFDINDRPGRVDGLRGFFTSGWRQFTARELWNKYNEQMRAVIDEGLAANESIDQIMNRVFEQETNLMLATEKREYKIRRSNMKKKIVAVSAGALVGAFTFWAGGGFSKPDATSVASGPAGTPTGAKDVAGAAGSKVSGGDLTVSGNVYSPYAVNVDLGTQPGLLIDSNPGILQSIAAKLNMNGVTMLKADPSIAKSILAANKNLGGNIDTIVNAGDKIKIPMKAAKSIASILGPNWSAADVLKSLKA